ncbi:MAG: 23S rRNA (pseudouridine(1915)-N(3))-methyltransferase RlmH [Pyrinomonadaceae bacterium]|nr:23S rRNA (pseudouridine(1915)-N(3))-methyltransferase RlmH [Pyrinomonadaceae bacterium]
MKFRFVWVGKTRDKHWRALQDEYLHRLSHFVKCEIAETRDSAPHEGAEIEGKRILQLVNPKCLVVLLDVKGEQLSSHALAAKVEKWQTNGVKEVAFIIGGATGISREVAERADDRLSLSFLTFTHETARVLLLEQLYRAYSIINGFPYQK